MSSTATRDWFRSIPRWHQAARRFVELGFFHILDGTDHCLFLLCLVIPFRRFRAAGPGRDRVHRGALDHADRVGLRPGAGRLWFPPLIETLIAASIVYMALENIVGAQHGAAPLDDRVRIRPGARLRLLVRAAGDAAVRGLAPAHVAALVQYRRRTGQVAGAVAAHPAARLLFRFVVAERMGTIILSALVAHTGWHWMIERADHLRQFRLWPGA